MSKEIQILDGAFETFCKHGYSHASVDLISRTAKVSKATLYQYFPGKSELFAAVIERECLTQVSRLERLSEQLIAAETYDAFEDQLTQLGKQLTRAFISTRQLSMFRIVAAEAERFPELARTFFESGPAFGARWLAAVLERASQAGFLKISHPERGAHHFMALCRTELLQRAMFLHEEPTDAQIEDAVQDAMTTFLYGRKTKTNS